MIPLPHIAPHLDPRDVHPAYEPLLSAAATSGRCPVLVTGWGAAVLRPPDDPGAAVDLAGLCTAESVLAALWPSPACGCGCVDPFGDAFPGLLPRVRGGPTVDEFTGWPLDEPQRAAVALAGRVRAAHLAVVPACRAADAVAALGWTAENGVGGTVEGLTAVLRSWEDRFGALLVLVDGDELVLSVAAPPVTEQECLRTAAEHWALGAEVRCGLEPGVDPEPGLDPESAHPASPWAEDGGAPDRDGRGGRPAPAVRTLRDLAATLNGSTVWRLRWS